jgi:hypothetical protein
MKRRQFLYAFGYTLVAKPLFALAQQQGKVPLVGILDTDATPKFENLNLERSSRPFGTADGYLEQPYA